MMTFPIYDGNIKKVPNHQPVLMATQSVLFLGGINSSAAPSRVTGVDHDPSVATDGRPGSDQQIDFTMKSADFHGIFHGIYIMGFNGIYPLVNV
jgi:hypothetical protein